MDKITLKNKHCVWLMEFKEVGNVEAVWPDGARSGRLRINYTLHQLKELGWEVVKPKQMVNK